MRGVYADAAMPATSSRALVDAALEEVRTVSVGEALQRFSAGSARFIDVREAAELRRDGALPGACLVPRGVIEFWADVGAAWHRADIFERLDQPLVLYCAIGWRSALAAQSLQALGYTDVVHIGGGFEAWRAAGAPVQAPGAAPPRA
jgi:rhodanese-related sulfurtransferase